MGHGRNEENLSAGSTSSPKQLPVNLTHEVCVGQRVRHSHPSDPSFYATMCVELESPSESNEHFQYSVSDVIQRGREERSWVFSKSLQDAVHPLQDPVFRISVLDLPRNNVKH